MQIEEEPQSAYEQIPDIYYIKPKTNERYVDPLLWATADSFMIALSQNASLSPSVIDEKKLYVEKIPYADITDMVFPSLKKINESEKKRYAIKLVRGRDPYIIGLAEKSFFQIRKLFEDILYMKQTVS